MDFRALGSMSVQENGEELLKAAGKPRQLLALLLLNEPYRVPNSALITELWDDAPPQHPMTTLQTHIFYLRKEFARTVGVESGVIAQELLQTHNGGYRINLGDARFDLREFHRLRNQAQALLHAGDQLGAGPVVCEALRRWRGPALLDVEHGRLLHAAVAKLDESRLDTLAMFFCTQLATGRHREILSELARLVVRHPHHERLRIQFAIALHQSGYRPQALQALDELPRAGLQSAGRELSEWVAGLRHAIQVDDLTSTDVLQLKV